MGWDCPRCAAENSLDAKCCWRCGYQYFAAPEPAGSPREGSGQSQDELRKEREEIRQRIEKDLEAAMERTNAALEHLATGPKRGGS